MLIFYSVWTRPQGATYSFPCRPAEGQRTDHESITATFKRFQQDVASASSILVVGGGPVGIEFAAEVAVQYPGVKNITLATSTDGLMSTFRPKVGKELHKQLTSMGIKVVYESKVDISGLHTGKITPKQFDLGPAGSLEGALQSESTWIPQSGSNGEM